MPATLTLSTHSQWVADIIEHLESTTDLTRSDAQGIVLAQEFRMAQLWGRGVAAPQAAADLLACSRPIAAQDVAPVSERAQWERAVCTQIALTAGLDDAGARAVMERNPAMTTALRLAGTLAADAAEHLWLAHPSA